MTLWESCSLTFPSQRSRPRHAAPAVRSRTVPGAAAAARGGSRGGLGPPWAFPRTSRCPGPARRSWSQLDRFSFLCTPQRCPAAASAAPALRARRHRHRPRPRGAGWVVPGPIPGQWGGMCRAGEKPLLPRPPPGPVAVPPSRLCVRRPRGRGKRADLPPAAEQVARAAGAAAGRSGGRRPPVPSEPARTPGALAPGRLGQPALAARSAAAAHASAPRGRREGGRRQPRARRQRCSAAAREAPGPGALCSGRRRPAAAGGRHACPARRLDGKLSGGGRQPGRKLPPLAPNSEKVVALLPAAKGCGREEVSCFGTTGHLQFFSDSPSPAQSRAGKDSGRLPPRERHGNTHITARPREPRAQSQILRYVQ